MARIRAGFQRGTITSNPLGAGSTSIASDQFAVLPEIVAPDYLVLVLDPESAFGAPEIVHVTAHAPAATTVTVTRGSAITEPEGDTGTASREHPVNTVWRHGATVADYGEGGVVDTYIIKESNESVNNSVTLQDDDDLFFAVDEDSVYEFSGQLIIATNGVSGGTPGFRVNTSFPSAALADLVIQNSNTVFGTVTSGGSDVTGGGTGNASVNRFFNGVVRTGVNSGTFRIRWAQQTADATNSTTFLAGSFLRYRKVL